MTAVAPRPSAPHGWRLDRLYSVLNNAYMKSVTLSTRVAPGELAEVDALARRSGLDRSAMAKSLVRRGLRELCLDQAIEAYAARRVTLSRAAEIAKMPVSDFLLEIDKRSLTLHYDVEDLEEDLNDGR